MLAFLALLAPLAAAQDPLRVGPRTGDFPTVLEWCTSSPVVTPWVVRRSVDWAAYGALPVKRHFAAEIAASVDHVAHVAHIAPVLAASADPSAAPPAAPIDAVAP